MGVGICLRACGDWPICCGLLCPSYGRGGAKAEIVLDNGLVGIKSLDSFGREGGVPEFAFVEVMLRLELVYTLLEALDVSVVSSKLNGY